MMNARRTAVRNILAFISLEMFHPAVGFSGKPRGYEIYDGGRTREKKGLRRRVSFGWFPSLIGAVGGRPGRPAAGAPVRRSLVGRVGGFGVRWWAGWRAAAGRGGARGLRPPRPPAGCCSLLVPGSLCLSSWPALRYTCRGGSSLCGVVSWLGRSRCLVWWLLRRCAVGCSVVVSVVGRGCSSLAAGGPAGRPGWAGRGCGPRWLVRWRACGRSWRWPPACPVGRWRRAGSRSWFAGAASAAPFLRGGAVRVVFVGGSRSVSAAGSVLVGQLAGRLAAAGCSVVTCCAAGVCAAVRSAVPSAVVFSSAGPRGWQLAVRSRAALASVASSPRGAAVVVFGAVRSPGSLGEAVAAARLGLPLFAFCVAPVSGPPPLPGVAGSWSSSSLVGLPCWRFVPAQLVAF